MLVVFVIRRCGGGVEEYCVSRWIEPHPFRDFSMDVEASVAAVGEEFRA